MEVVGWWGGGVVGWWGGGVVGWWGGGVVGRWGGGVVGWWMACRWSRVEIPTWFLFFFTNFCTNSYIRIHIIRTFYTNCIVQIHTYTNCMVQIHTIRTFFIQIVLYQFIQQAASVQREPRGRSPRHLLPRPGHTRLPRR
jgi:hypothetical protein